MAELRRQDDTYTVMADQGWTKEKNGKQIAEVDAQCQKLRERDWLLAQPFQGPLERFQWRVSKHMGQNLNENIGSATHTRDKTSTRSWLNFLMQA